MKKTRSRLKSTTSESQAVSEEQMANSNGGKSEAGEAAQETSVTEPDVQSKLDEVTEDESTASDSLTEEVVIEKTPHGRKRKASEMKATESDNEDSQGVEKVVVKVEVDSESVDNDKTNEKDESRSEDAASEGMLDGSSDISMTRQLLRKGKRARVPNKRYSDFPLKSTRGSSEPMEVDFSKENGEKENVERESGSNSDLNKGDASEHSSSAYSSPNVAISSVKGSRLSQVNSPSTPAKKQKLTVDLTNPIYMKPFKFGWKRELVYRTTNDNNNKRNGDIYYYTPTGKKVRSMREVSENLKNKELSLEDFTFFKEPLGLDDPEKEIIRDAKVKSATSTPAAAKKSTPKPIRKPTPSVASPKIVIPPPVAEVVEEPKPKNSPRLSAFKIKLGARSNPSNKGKLTNKKKEKDDADLEIGNWASSNKKTSKSGNKSAVSPKKTRRSAAAVGTISSISNRAAKVVEDVTMDNYLQSVAFGYSTLLHVFQYLKVQDLLRAGCVCSMWRDMASHSSLWKTVRMKNSQIHSFKGLANALEKYGTVHLDLRKMLLPSNSSDDIWQEFTSEIKKVESLKKIELCRCPAVVVEQLAMSNPKLEVVNAVTIKCESMNIAPISYLPNLQELRLKSTSGFALTSNLTALAELKHLKHLSLTSIRDLNELKISVIADLQNLESLDLGECVDFPRTFGSEILSKLEKLEKLRLEKGQGNCYTFEILEAVKNMKQLDQLELVNFDIKTGFDRALGACTNIKKLLIIPTYISQSATTNHMVLGGVLRLQATLSHFVWGVTLELLRVTELFVDQCEDPEKKEKKEKKPISNGDSIPVLKPVPLLRDGSNVEIPPAQDPPQVEILPLPNLQKLLLQSLPTTRVKILKIPFHATWRQSITDTVN